MSSRAGFVSAADVALRAGVSRSAVSRAFTPGGCVSEDARRRILRAAEELGYRVNRLAQTLHQERSDLVGVVGANFSNPYISAQFEALSAALHRNNLQCLLMNTGQVQGDADIGRLLDFRVRTVVLLSGAVPDNLIRLCIANGVRMVLINRPYLREGTHADQIVADSAAGGRLAAQRLLAAGCRNVAEMAREDLPVTRWAQGANSYQTGVDAARQLLVRPDIDGIFGVTDEIALGVLNTARFEIGRSVPEDLSVIGFDDAPISEWSSHRLTSIRQSLPDLTSATIKAIDRAPDAPPLRIKIPVTLIERDSVAPKRS